LTYSHILGEDVNIINHTESLLQASRDVGLEVNTENTKYNIMSRHQNAGQTHNLHIC